MASMVLINERTGVLTGIFLLMTVSAATAQQAPARSAPPHPAALGQRSSQAQPVPDIPQRTTATYADWVVQCQTRTGTPPEKLCDMAQVTQLQGNNLPFSRVAVAHPIKGQPVKLSVQVPVNVSFATNVRLQTSTADSGIAVPFARCIPSGCFADFDLKDDTLTKFRSSAGATGRLTFVDASGHEIVAPLSFNGFAQAFDALARE